jgi:hypothetical protein
MSSSPNTSLRRTRSARCANGCAMPRTRSVRCVSTACRRGKSERGVGASLSGLPGGFIKRFGRCSITASASRRSRRTSPAPSRIPSRSGGRFRFFPHLQKSRRWRTSSALPSPSSPLGRACDQRNGSLSNAATSTAVPEAFSPASLHRRAAKELRQAGRKPASRPPLRSGTGSARAAAAEDRRRFAFPWHSGGHLNLNTWRRDAWTPAVKAAGLAHRSPYALRHTFAAWSIAAGIGLFELARFMGTSVEQIDRTYGHLLPDSIDPLAKRWRRWGTLRPPRKAMLPSVSPRKAPAFAGTSSHRGARTRTGDLQSPRLVQRYGGCCRRLLQCGLAPALQTFQGPERFLFAENGFSAFVPEA